MEAAAERHCRLTSSLSVCAVDNICMTAVPGYVYKIEIGNASKSQHGIMLQQSTWLPDLCSEVTQGKAVLNELHALSRQSGGIVLEIT